MDTSLSAYHTYLTLGWPVLPLCPRGKEPIGQLVPNGLKDATTDLATVEQWLALYPDMNAGIRTGAESGLVVLDIDDKAGGWESLQRLGHDEDVALNATLIVATGGGGAHLYLKHPGGSIPNSSNRIAPGIDLRADGGYVVAPPSIHANGNPYLWLDGSTPGDVPPAPAPSWIFDHERRESPRLQDDETITEGGRNNRLMRIGSGFRRYGLTESEIAAALHVVNKSRCRPPLEPDEVERIAASVARYQPEARIKVHKKPRISVVGGQVVAA